MKSLRKSLNHIAIIMDGNRTWSKRNNLNIDEGHKAGVKTAKKIVSYTIEKNIRNLTLFALSSENLTRSKFELKNLFDIFFYSFAEEKEFLYENQIRVRFIGDLSKLPKKLKKNAEFLEDSTKKYKNLNLFIALNYGGKQDIRQAVKKASKEEGRNSNFEKHMFSKDLPEVDLLIRTGGFKRLSNFIIWQISYAELYFTDVLWPNFNKRSFSKSLNWYSSVDRKFGKS